MSYPAAYGYNGDGVDGVDNKIRLKRTFLQKEMLPSISSKTWHPNSSTGNALSLLI
jgi:hypothetical protein